MGVEFNTDLNNSRQLYTIDTTGRYKVLLVRPWDVPVYVEEGAADLGIVGKDVLLEQNSPLTEISDLKFGSCSLVLAGRTLFHQQKLNKTVK